MKLFKRSTEKAASDSVVKAHLIGLGSGSLEFIDNSLRFYIEKGRFKKQQQLAKEIPTVDIHEVILEGKELSITWKGSHDIFVLDDIESSEVFLGKVLRTSEEPKKASEDEIVVKPQSSEVGKILNAGLDITDFLFDILKSLNGWIDWNRVKGLVNKSVSRFGEIKDQKFGFLELDFSNIKLAVNEHEHKEVSKEALDLLRLLYDNFVNAESENTGLRAIHPNYFEAKTAIHANYILNDIALGSILGDKTVIEEQRELFLTLEDLGKSANLKINTNLIESIVGKLCDEMGKESLIIESRRVFRSQLKNLITD